MGLQRGLTKHTTDLMRCIAGEEDATLAPFARPTRSERVEGQTLEIDGIL
jgi:hypothetical protein